MDILYSIHFSLAVCNTTLGEAQLYKGDIAFVHGEK